MQHIVGRAAVHSDGDYLRHPGGHRERLFQRLAGAGLLAGDGVAQPGRHPRAADEIHQRLGFVDVGHGLEGEDVRTGVGQDLQPWPVPVAQLGDGQSVAAAVLLSAGQRRAVGSDRGGDQALPAGPTACSSGQFDAEAQQPLSVGAVDAALGEAVEGGLITGRGGDPGAGGEERLVHRDDVLGRIHQQPGRPQVVGQIVTAGLQFGGQAAVSDQHGILKFEHHHGVTLRALAGCGDNSGDTPGARWCVTHRHRPSQALCSPHGFTRGLNTTGAIRLIGRTMAE